MKIIHWPDSYKEAALLKEEVGITPLILATLPTLLTLPTILTLALT